MSNLLYDWRATPRGAARLLICALCLSIANAALQPLGSRMLQPAVCARSSVVLMKAPRKKGASKRVAPAPAKGFASGPPPSSSPGWNELRRWLTERGAKVDGMDVDEVLPGLRGAVATKKYAVGDVIMSVPRKKCILDENRAEASPAAAVWQEAPIETPPYAKVALHVLWLARTGKWSPVVDMLPTMADWNAEGGPMQLWTDEEVAACEDVVLSERVDRRKAVDLELYEKVVLPGWQAALQLPTPTLDEFLWAVVTIRSRSFKQKAAGGIDTLVVPGVDLCNHDHPGRVNTQHDFEDGEFKLVATKPIGVGKEIRLTYGPKPNRQLLMQFGFVLPNSLALSRQLLGDDAAPIIDLFGALPGDVDAAQAEQLCQDGHLLRTSAGGGASPTQPIGAHLELAVERLGVRYADVLRSALQDGFSTSAQHDEDMLGEGAPPLSPRQRLAAQYRLSQKALLQTELEAAQGKA